MEEDSKVITYGEVEERLKNVKLDDMTSEDVFDKYVGYGDPEDFENITVQKLMLKFGYVEELIYSVATILTDEKVVNGIISSNLFKDNNFILIRGKIENLEMLEDNELSPMEMCYMIIHFIDQANNKYKIKHIYYKAKEEKYKKEIEQNIGNDLMAVVENKNNEYRLCCLLKDKH